MTSVWHRLTSGALAAGLLLTAACDEDPSGPIEQPTAEIGVVLNSVDVSLTLFTVEDPSLTATVELGPDGSPVGVAVRGAVAVVPLGVVPAVAVVDLVAADVTRTVALPEGSGATGVAFANDSIALVANSSLDTVSPVNVRTGAVGAAIEVGGYPQAAVAVNDTVYVLNAELGPDFQPAGPGTVSVLTGTPLAVVETIALSGLNPGAAAIGEGAVYVLNSGRFGMGDGSLSVIDRGTLTEVDHHDGFGEFPGSIAVDDAGLAYVGGFGLGLLVWDTEAEAFVRGPEDPVAPGGITSVSAIGVDSADRLYTLEPDCQGPAQAFRLTEAFDVDERVGVGICPIAIGFTELPVDGT